MALVTVPGLGKVEVSVGLLAAVALLCYLGQGEILLVFGASALIHELGHLLAARLLGFSVTGFRLTAFGGELVTQGLVSRWRDAVVLAAGPGANLLQGVLCLMGGAPVLAGSGVILGVLNLLPIEPLDGGELLRLGLEGLLPLWTADEISRWISLLCAAALLLLGGVLWLGLHGTPALAFFGGWLLMRQWKSGGL